MRNQAIQTQNSAKPAPVMASAFLKFGNLIAAQMAPAIIAMTIRKCMGASYAH